LYGTHEFQEEQQMTRLLTIVSSLAVVAAVGVGGALAAGYDYPSDNPTAKVTTPQHNGSKWRKKLRQFKDYEQSQVALSAYMTGKAEIDQEGNDGVGDPDAKGTAMLLIVDERTICYGFSLRGAETPMAAHIHRAPAGTNGDVVIPFANVPKDANGNPAGDPGASSGCKTLTEPGELAALRRLLAKPKNYYVNFHTTSFPDGAVRGQLSRVLYDND
jgi:hypothetical protein